MALREYLEQACEQIDAAIFTGDTLYNPEEVVELKGYLARWNRALVEAAEPWELVEFELK